MKALLNHWKVVAIVTVASLLITLQPVITYACNTAGDHCGG